jgi:hypothetical protein
MSSSTDPSETSTASMVTPAHADLLVQPVADWRALGLSAPENRHGHSIRVWARVSPGQAADALAYEPLSESAWRFTSDAPPGLADGAADRYPLSLMHVGLAASYMNEIFGAADTRDVEIHELDLVQDNYYLLGDASSPDAPSAQALPLELEIRIASSTAADELGELLLGALAAAPQYALLRQATDMALAASSDGVAIALEDAAPMEALPPSDFAAAWAWELATVVPHAPLVTQIERTPAESGSTPPPIAAAQSPSAHLHGRATCRLNQDGVKRIEHRWRGELGPAYAFLSDEAEGYGGQSFAPDATTYMAAGLALSFVTQLARAAGAQQGPPGLCRAIVDVHFPFGGLIEPGVVNLRLDPIQIHVALSGATSPETARALLRRSQRACALQALCRTRLVTNIRIRTL